MIIITTAIHTGLKAILDFDENVEYLEGTNFNDLIKECNDIMSQNDVPKEIMKISNSKYRTIIVLVILCISVILIYLLLPDSKWINISNIINVLAGLITVYGGLKKSFSKS